MNSMFSVLSSQEFLFINFRRGSGWKRKQMSGLFSMEIKRLLFLKASGQRKMNQDKAAEEKIPCYGEFTQRSDP